MYFVTLKEPLGLAGAEARALCEAYHATVIGERGKTLFIDRAIPFNRLTLAHEACELLGGEEDLGRFRVTGPQGTAAELGRRLKGVVDLDRPESVVRALDERLFGRVVWEFSQADYERRMLKHHTTLRPELARLLVNLARAREHQSLLDPFCGTGTILLEAGRLMIRAVGSDVSPDMVEKCRRNGLRNVHIADIRKLHLHEKFDAIATDLPYGRGSRLEGEKPEVYEAAFTRFSELLRPGGHAAVMASMPLDTDRLALVETHGMRVHRSLDRHIMVFRK